MASFADRVVGAVKLSAATYEEVEHDMTATSQAAAVIALSSIASGIGGYWLLGITGIVRGALIALVGWVIGAVALWFIGTKVIPGKNTEGDIGQVLRTVGFAGAPGLLRVLGVIPGLGLITSVVAGVWTLIATVVAVRVALDYDDNVKAIIACLIAAVVLFVASALLASVLVWF